MAYAVLIDQLTRALDDGKFVVGIPIDIPKALDTIGHDTLLTKLSHYDFCGSIVIYQIDSHLLLTMAYPIQ